MVIIKKVVITLGIVLLVAVSIFTGIFLAKSKDDEEKRKNAIAANLQSQIEQQKKATQADNTTNNKQGEGNSENKEVTQNKAQDNNKINGQANEQQSIEDIKNSIVITSAYPSEPNSAGGVDLNINWKNISSKTIKYAIFRVVPYNAVNDIVESSIGGKTEAGVRVTGPIKPNETYGDGKVWECVWYNNTIRTVEVIGAEVIYMDGTSIKIDKDQIKYIIRGHGN